MLLPDVPREGIVINLPELRLYYFPKDKAEVMVLPHRHRGHRARDAGDDHHRHRQPEPDLGARPHGAQVLAGAERHRPARRGPPVRTIPSASSPCASAGSRDYLIHGTNKDFGVGLRVSAGCIRLRPDDIETLFGLVPVGTQVRVINQPVRWRWNPMAAAGWGSTPLSRTEAEMADGAPLVLSPRPSNSSPTLR